METKSVPSSSLATSDGWIPSFSIQTFVNLSTFRFRRNPDPFNERNKPFFVGEDIIILCADFISEEIGV